MLNLKVYGCDHCGSIFQSKSIYGFEPKRCMSCGTSLIQEMTREQLKPMLMSDSVSQEVKNNLIEMMALMPMLEKPEVMSCITCVSCKEGKDDKQYPYSFYSCEKGRFSKANDDTVEQETDCNDYVRRTCLSDLAEVMAPFFTGTIRS